MLATHDAFIESVSICLQQCCSSTTRVFDIFFTRRGIIFTMCNAFELAGLVKNNQASLSHLPATEHVHNREFTATRQLDNQVPTELKITCYQM